MIYNLNNNDIKTEDLMNKTIKIYCSKAIYLFIECDTSNALKQYLILIKMS